MRIDQLVYDVVRIDGSGRVRAWELTAGTEGCLVHGERMKSKTGRKGAILNHD
jgi:hypothetical protein